jgi:hypothetical protein
MIQEPSEIDNFFKKKLFDHESEPLDNSWEKLSASLDVLDKKQNMSLDKKQSLIYWSIAASVSLLLSCMAVFWILGQDEKQMAVLPITSLEKEKVVADKPEKVLSEKGDELVPTDEVFVQKIEQPKKVELVQTSEKPQPILKQTFGQKREFVLPDSSKVYLNRNSQITYSENFVLDRIVHIQNGEVFFEVKHLENQPFVVYANLSKTEVLGTSFMIRSYKDEKNDELYVSTGKVAFSSLKNPSERIILTKGLQSEVGDSERLESTPILDLNFNAWKNEKIVFNNTKLDEVSSTLEKYYAVSLQLKDPEILNCRFTGTFEKSGINEILKILAVSFNLSYDKQEGKYIISGKGCK